MIERSRTKWIQHSNANLMQKALAGIVTLSLLFFAVNAYAEDDPIVVRVGKVTYPLSEVQAYWDSIAQMADKMDYSLTDDDIQQYQESVIESYVSMGILENKSAAFGLDQLTADDQTALEEDAKRVYAEKIDELAQNIAKQYGKTLEEAKQFAPTFMELYGYTMDSAREEALRTLKEERILQYVTKDIPEPSEDEVTAYYETNLVAPSREAYADDIEAFETDVLYYGNLSYYIPEGYRYVRQILLPADSNTKSRAEAEEAELAALDDHLATARNKLYGYQALGEDTTVPQQEYDALIQDRQAKATQLQATLDEALTLHADELTEIYARLDAGESFSDLMAEYSQDTQMPQEGYMVCAKSVLWSASFRDAAMALIRIGDVGEPVTTSAGVHIIEYASNAPAGAVALEGDLKDDVTGLALRAKQYDVLEAFIQQWRSEYDIETHVELLSVPEVLQQ